MGGSGFGRFRPLTYSTTRRADGLVTKRSNAFRTSVIGILILSNVTLFAGPAFSGGLARVQAQTSASTGDWAEIVRTIGSTAQTGTTGVSRTLTTNGAAVYDRTLELANVGSLDLLSTSITVTITRTSGTGNPTVTGVYLGCRNGVWSAAATPTCSGTQVTIGTASGGVNSTTTFAPTIAMTAGSTMPIRLAMTSTRAGTFAFTASVTITRARARAAVISQS